MKARTKLYIDRKKALNNMGNFTDIKSLLKAEFFATNNILVKRDILKTYQSLKAVEHIK